ncbi:DNA polymerase III subunit alpha, partial [Candidatus Peregrinibacteria bacterium]|nr:DNA polymerase III subunit alpha [Candidatus Peregrinibacteria bacterium]
VLAKTAKEQGSSAIALTDNGVMYGAIEFYKACQKEGIKPIIGMEAYIAPRSLYKKEFKSDGRPWTLVLLAETQEGYQNLLKLSSIAHMEGMYYKPRIDLEVLEKYKKGLIALSGGFSGEIPHAILEGFLDEDIEKVIKKYLDIFGKNNFFFELSYHPNLPGQLELNEKLTELGEQFKVETVVAQNSYYISQDDAEAQDILSCIAMNRQVDDDSRSTMIDEDYSLLPPEEIISTFENNKKAIENTGKIAERCKVEFDFGAYHIPDIYPPKDHSTKTPMNYFRHECIEGLKIRYPQFQEHLEKTGWKSLENSTKYEEKDSSKCEVDSKKHEGENSETNQNMFSGETIAKRFEYEFEIIKKMGFESYFLMVWDYIKWAKDNGIMVGPGRGSGAGSIIAYALKITDLEPLQYSLLFERFLNPERVSMPDFDVDFQDNRIGEVLNYVSEKYGEDHVARICTFGTLAARAAVKDVGRAMGVTFEKMNMVSKLIPDRPGTKLAEAWESEPILKDTIENDEELKKIWGISLKLEGCVRHISVHACGVVISPEALEKYSAVQHPPKDSTSVISQFSGKPLESLGLLKMDFLGLKNLSILDTAIKIIKRTKGVNIELEKISVTDEKTFEVFQNAQTTGVFQFESAGMKRYLKELKPTVFEDLIAMNSLYRPGPMEFIPDFIKRKHGKVHIAYPHKSLAEILKPTYGIAVYQEQILQMAQAYAGYSLGQADILRRAIGKKIAE